MAKNPKEGGSSISADELIAKISAYYPDMSAEDQEFLRSLDPDKLMRIDTRFNDDMVYLKEQDVDSEPWDRQSTRETWTNIKKSFEPKPEPEVYNPDGGI